MSTISIPNILMLKYIQGKSEETDKQKKSYHSSAKKFLRSLAKEIGLDEQEFDLRSNLAGPAVSGEITLHDDSIFIQISSDFGILYRTCESKRDYSGGANNSTSFEKFKDNDFQQKIINQMKSMIESSKSKKASKSNLAAGVLISNAKSSNAPKMR